MVLGSGTFIPNAKFAVPRSYLRGIWLSFDTPAIVSWSDNAVNFADSAMPVVTGRIAFLPEFWAWNSNRYTLDFTIIESWYSFNGGVTQIPLPYCLTWYHDNDMSTYLVYGPFCAVGTGAFKHDMPPAPPDYWQPMPWQ